MARERLLYRCPLCAKVAPPAAFAAGARGDDTHALLAKVVTFVGGGREGRPKVQALDDRGRPRFDVLGQPVMVLARDLTGKPVAGRGFEWSERDLTLEERDALVKTVRAVAIRIGAQLIVDVLMNAAGDDFHNFAEHFKQEAVNDATSIVELVDEVIAARLVE